MNGILIITGCQFDELFAKRLGLIVNKKYKNDLEVKVLYLASKVPSDFKPSNPFNYFDEDLFAKFLPDITIEPNVGFEQGIAFYRLIKKIFQPAFLIDLHDDTECKTCNVAKDSCDNLQEGELEYHIGITAWNFSRYSRSLKNRQLLLKCAEIIKPLKIEDDGNGGYLTLHYGNRIEDPPDPDDGEIIIELKSARNKTSELATLNMAESIIDVLIVEAKKLIKTE